MIPMFTSDAESSETGHVGAANKRMLGSRHLACIGGDMRGELHSHADSNSPDDNMPCPPFTLSAYSCYFVMGTGDRGRDGETSARDTERKRGRYYIDVRRKGRMGTPTIRAHLSVSRLQGGNNYSPHTSEQLSTLPRNLATKREDKILVDAPSPDGERKPKSIAPRDAVDAPVPGALGASC